MSEFVKPPPDPTKMAEHWAAWTAGEELPGRTMADLKIARLDVVLETVSADSELAASLWEIWSAWERGKAVPQATLDQLAQAGAGDFIGALATAS